MMKIYFKRIKWWLWVLCTRDCLDVTRKIMKELDKVYNGVVYSSHHLIIRLGTIEKSTQVRQNIVLGIIAGLTGTFLSVNFNTVYKMVNPLMDKLTLPNIVKILNLENGITSLNIMYSLFELLIMIVIFLLMLIIITLLIIKWLQLLFSSPYHTFILPYERVIVI